MRPASVSRTAALVSFVILLAAGTAANAQGSYPTSRSDRLFVSFAQDATVVEGQWWEARVALEDVDSVDILTLRGIVAFEPLEDIEVGGAVGFGSTSAPAFLPDGSGATDLDLWGKFHFATGDATEFALGALATVPTGDDTAGLGYDSVGLEAFASVRRALRQAIVNVNGGLRLNEDGRRHGVDLNGRNSPFLAGAVIYPISDRVAVLGETRIETKRFDGGDSDVRILGGINWMPTSRGTVRAALAIGVTDGAPDSQLFVGFAYSL